ncbi:MAG: AAA family ATPase [Acidimicrobiales bacterium]|nr:AAA family ATPase [Acidimicrobiales bacterium]
MLILVGGLPGTGKSTLARGLAEATGATLIRSDEVRKELAAGAPSTSRDAGYRQGPYRPELTAATYDAMLGRARTALGLGRSVILDASWSSEEQRQAARRVAAGTGSEVVELACLVAAPEAYRRIKARRARGDDPSDATVDVARAMGDDADPWPSARPIDTSGSQWCALGQALDALPSGPAQQREGREEGGMTMDDTKTERPPNIHAAVASLAIRPVVTVPEGASLAEVARRLEEANISAAVVGAEQKLGRIVTERDLTRAMAHRQAPEDVVDTTATQGPVWVTPGTSLLEAAQIMVRHEVRHLLVILPTTGEVVGVVSMRDVLPVLLRAAERLPSTVAPD